MEFRILGPVEVGIDGTPIAVDSDPRFAATLLGAARSTRDDTEIRVSPIEG